MPIVSIALLGMIWVVPMSTPSADPLTILVNYGGLIGAFVLVIVGRLHTSAEVDTLQKQVDALYKQLATKDDQLEAKEDLLRAKDSLLTAMAQSLTQRAIPGMQQMSTVLEAIPSQETALAKLLREALEKVDALTSKLPSGGEGGGP